MIDSGPLTVEEIIIALWELDGEAQAKEIKDRVTENRGGGIPPQYSHSHSYRETMQKIIEDYCPQSSNFRGIACFERVERGRYRLITDQVEHFYPLLIKKPVLHKPVPENEGQNPNPQNKDTKTFSEDNGNLKLFKETEEEAFPEGKEVYRLHRTKERNPMVISQAKQLGLQNDPHLCCQVCGFSFIKTYGKLGQGFIEAHHTFPLSDLTEETETKIDDIALVCSNCHRMLHRRRPWLKLNELKSLLEKEIGF